MKIFENYGESLTDIFDTRKKAMIKSEDFFKEDFKPEEKIIYNEEMRRWEYRNEKTSRF